MVGPNFVIGQCTALGRARRGLSGGFLECFIHLLHCVFWLRLVLKRRVPGNFYAPFGFDIVSETLR